MILPVHLVNRFYEQLSFYSCTVSNFEQYTLAAFINNGYFEKHINRMRLYYIRQRKQIINYIEESNLNDYCGIIENESGLHFLIKLDTELSDAEVIKRLNKKGIQIRALSQYFLTDNIEKEHYFIINYSNIDINKIPEAFENIYLIIHS